ncbi:hypothetical protein FGO68_gene5736 [Halteria grandinella]|uniref:Uncharacterized protein n=1 Tax=Halteria grandinella TaxID=5974 RepID=A0A8J8NFQ2_HALGN|nr:hypothetical protein FGO68_gene5736 [Halteria grandinella]
MGQLFFCQLPASFLLVNSHRSQVLLNSSCCKMQIQKISSQNHLFQVVLQNSQGSNGLALEIPHQFHHTFDCIPFT